ncbi:MarR family winged helix-turn-helix transcriptional regulator [Pseudoroseomonas cervicalis]|uniref:MarR family winged helix-turn-helix transcriptional regulator n=1 Tax=Teichococcus cervicalis TaxID=204525 RepID=UPI00278786A9|nr:MarR family transcriptional regulator [Pseudoroseomonas cervicalis]MDQ1078702.1 DNA-binding MarR family transcriptional regulator [Pseudoroseomonas cervicalis]
MDAARARQEAIDLGPLPGLLGHLLRRAHTRMLLDFTESTAEYGITSGEFALLCLVEANPGITLGQLAQAAGLDKSTLSPAVQRLAERGLVERHAVSGDRRAQALHLSEAGQALLPPFKARIAEHEERLAAPLSASERAVLTRLLRKLNGL